MVVGSVGCSYTASECAACERSKAPLVVNSDFSNCTRPHPQGGAGRAAHVVFGRIRAQHYRVRRGTTQPRAAAGHSVAERHLPFQCALLLLLLSAYFFTSLPRRHALHCCRIVTTKNEEAQAIGWPAGDLIALSEMAARCSTPRPYGRSTVQHELGVLEELLAHANLQRTAAPTE